MTKLVTINEKVREACWTGVSNLKEVVSDVLTTYNTPDGGSVFINDVPEDLVLRNDAVMVQSVLNGLVSSITRVAPGRAIRIVAKIYTDIVLLHIRQDGEEQTDIPANMKELQMLASSINGIVNITSCRANVTTFAFSFPNAQSAA